MNKAENMKHEAFLPFAVVRITAQHSQSMPTKNTSKFMLYPLSAHIWLSPLMLNTHTRKDTVPTQRGRGDAAGREAVGQERVVLPRGPTPKVHVHVKL